MSYTIPRVKVNINSAPIIPPPPSTGVLGVIMKLESTGTEGSTSVEIKSFTNSLEFFEWKKTQSVTSTFFTYIENAFANGLPSLRLLTMSNLDDEEIEKFRAKYPEINLVMIDNELNSDGTKVESYVNNSRSEGTPCLGILPHNNNTKDKTGTDIIRITPENAIGAVAGKIANLPFHHSATLKNINLSGDLYISQANLEKGIDNHLLIVANRPGRGAVIVKGITTTDEISVRRVAHYVARRVKQISESFLGELYTQDALDALKQKITEELLSLERQNAIVPLKDENTGAILPSHALMVRRDGQYSEGRVLIDLQIRPVRAIHYIDVNVNLIA